MKKRAKIKNLLNIDQNVALIFKLKSNKKEFFYQVVESFGDKVYTVAYNVTRNHSEAEEVYQDVFLTVYEKLDTLKNHNAFSSWIHRITVNLAKLKIRERIRNQILINRMEDITSIVSHEEPVLKETSAEKDILSAESKEIIENAIEMLPLKYKNVVILKDLKNLSIKETGQVLNISVPAVKSNLHRARRQLKTILNKYFLERVN